MPCLSLNYLWSKKTPVQYTEEEELGLKASWPPESTWPGVFSERSVTFKNRSALAVNCCVIIHCLEVSCKEDQITSAQCKGLIFVQPRTQYTRTGHLHTGKCIYWKCVVVAQRWLSFQN